MASTLFWLRRQKCCFDDKTLLLFESIDNCSIQLTTTYVGGYQAFHNPCSLSTFPRCQDETILRLNGFWQALVFSSQAETNCDHLVQRKEFPVFSLDIFKYCVKSCLEMSSRNNDPENVTLRQETALYSAARSKILLQYTRFAV